jgi:hypothetical protein
MGIPSRMDGRCVINGGWGGVARAEVNVRIVTYHSTFFLYQYKSYVRPCSLHSDGATSACCRHGLHSLNVPLLS